MKVWPLLVTVLLPLHTYAVVNEINDDGYGDDESYEESDEEEFEGFYGDDDFVSLSTGTKKLLAKAPSVASVITAKKIKQMGYRTLSEVLATVPGLHSAHNSELMAPKFTIRGISSQYNPQTLMLVNGTPISSVVRGDRHTVWGAFPVTAIARIEVIRGPGSALHGADAFAGVINVITKEFSDIEKTEIGVRGGSFNSTDLWAQSAFEFGELKVALTVELTDTDGHDEIIDSDNQSNIDGNGPDPDFPAISLAPGSVNVGYKGYDMRADLSYGGFTLKFGYQNMEDIGTGQGVAKALDPHGKLGTDRVLINLNYLKQINDDWKADLRLSSYRTNETNMGQLHLFPAGAFFGAFPVPFSGNPEWFEKNEMAKGHLTYTGLSKNTLTFGGGYRNEDLYRVLETKNFRNGVYLGELVDVSDTAEVFLPEADRHSYFAFIQDEIQVAPDWELTAGLRYDDYSDFGSTVNPRLALVWATNRNLSTKFLYGRAFRAPSIGETLIVNNPVGLGNPDVEPETIDTYEVAFNYQFSPQIHIDLNLYYFKAEDLIDFFPDPGGTATAQNSGELTGRGLEFELNYRITDSLNLLANYAYQNTEKREIVGKDDLGGAPNNQYYAQLIWSVTDSVTLNTEIWHIGKQERNHLDSRSATGSYTSVGFVLNYHEIFEGVDLQVKVNNAFDEDIREPSLGPSEASGGVGIPNDLPQAGTSVFVGIQKTF